MQPEKTVIDNLAEGREVISTNGSEKHVISYLKDFLFSPERCRTPVSALSGGEKARLLIAKLFSKPVNVLILDEPTNDLDIETLELLEEVLHEFLGTVIIVSHDRDFLDNIATSTIVFDGKGNLKEYIGGYSDLIRQGAILSNIDNAQMKKIDKGKVLNSSVEKQSNTKDGKKKLTYKLQLELKSLPEKIERLEREIEKIQKNIEDGSFYSQSKDIISDTLNQLNQYQLELDQKIERWTELEEMN